MKKIIRLTESDLTKIVKRVIRENEEQQITDEVTKTILDNISKEDLLTLGKLYNSMGEDEFKDVAEDVVDSVVGGETVSESIGLSSKGFTYDSKTEKSKLEVAKIITRLSSTILAIMTGSISLGSYRTDDIESAMVAGIIASAMIGANLVTRIPHNLKVEPLPEKLKGSRIEKIVDSEMKKIYSKEKDLNDFISHFESLGIPEKISTKFISNWAEKNNISFEEKRNNPRAK